MALDTICPHCRKKVILSYRIVNPYLYGSKIRKCPKCGGEIFDNRWREVAIQGFDPVQDTEVKYSSWFGFGLVSTGILFLSRDFSGSSIVNPAMIKAGAWFMLALGGLILIFFFRHILGFVKRKNAVYMAESVERLKNPEYVEILRSHGVKIPDSEDLVI